MENCMWCDHPVASHGAYYDGWCAWDVTIFGDGDPYSLSCWCGGTEATAGPRMVVRDSSIRLTRAGEGWSIPRPTVYTPL